MRKNKDKPAYELSKIENLMNDPFGYLVMGYYSTKNLKKQRELAETSSRQPNQLTQSIYRCSGTAQKLFVVAVNEFMKRGKTRKDRWVSLDLANTIFALNVEDGKATRNSFKKAVDEVGHLSVILQDDDEAYHMLNLFEEVKFDWNWGTLKYKLSEKFATFLEVEHKRGFTIFSVEVVGRLTSFYAMRYYQIAMSYRGFMGGVRDVSEWAKKNEVDLGHSWFFAFSIPQLRALFKIGDKEYPRVSDLKKYVIDNPIAELNAKLPALEFKVQTLRRNNTQKGKIEGFAFWVTDNTDKARQEKIERLKEAHMDRWREVYEQKMAQPTFFGRERTENLARDEADNALLKEFKDE